MDVIIKIVVLFTCLMCVREITCSATNVSISTSILDPATTPYPTTMKFTNATIIGTTATSLVSNTVSNVSSNSTQFTPTLIGITDPTNATIIGTTATSLVSNTVSTVSSNSTKFTPTFIGITEPTNATIIGTTATSLVSNSVSTVSSNSSQSTSTFGITEPTNASIIGTTATSLVSNTVSTVSSDSTKFTPTFGIAVPNAPAAPSLSPGSDATNTIVVSWTTPTGGNDIVDYVIEWSVNSATTRKIATGNSTTLTSLTPGELYSVNVKARNSAGAGAQSNNTWHRTNPNPPASFSVNTITANNEITFTFTAPVTPNVFSYYTLTTNANGTTNTTIISASDTTYTFTGGQPNMDYAFHLKAVSGTFVFQTESTAISVIVRTHPVITCPSQCKGCMGPCSLSSTGGCDCSCIDGYFPTQLDCQPVVCKVETLVHPTLLINVMFPILQAGFQSSSLETCGSETVNSGKPYGTRSCLLNGTSTTPIWLTSCDRGIQNIANVTITSIEERVAVANDLEILTSNPESLSSDDVTNTVQALNNVLNVPSITQQVSLSAVTVVSNMLNVPDDVFVASTGTDRLLAAIESVGTKVELDENGVYEAVTSNVGIAAIQHAVSADLVRTSFGIDNLLTNSDLGFRSDQVHLFGSESLDNVTGSISVPNSAASTNLGTSERISFLAFSNDKLFISSNGTYDDVNSVVVLSAAIGRTSVTNLVDPVVVQLMTNVTLNNGSNGRLSSCVFWDEGIQSWINGDVDSKVEETSDSVVCHFNHLTNFATLLARDDTGIVNTKALDIVSIVGSSISSFCLLLTILSFVCVPKLRIGGRLRGTVLLVNLSMALLLLNLLLIFSEQSFVYSSPDSCLAVGVLLHFSLLASFAWMNVEAVNLCLVIITPLYNRTHVNEKTVFILSHIWGWLVPSLFVAITCAVDLNLYRRGDHDRECWMQTHVVLYLVLIPMIIVLAFNSIAYVAVLVASVSANRVRKSRANSDSQRKQAVMSVSLFVLFGLTWIFGFGITGIGDSAVVFGYIFAVLNSLQGFFIFCLFIVRNKTARREIQSHITTRSSGTQQSTGNTKLQRPIETSSRDSTGSFKSGHSDAKLSTLQSSLDKITRGPRAHYNPTSTSDATISSQVFSDI